MSIPTGIDFAVAAGSTLTGFNDSGMGFRICTADTDVIRQEPSQDVTQQGDTDTYTTPSATVTAAVYRTTRRQIMRLRGSGFFQTSADAGATWDFQYAGPGGASITGAVQARVSRAIIQRNMGLINVTAANDALPKTLFTHTKVSYGGSVQGFLTAAETPLDNDVNLTPTTLAFAFGSGTVSGDGIFEGMDQSLHFNRGGPHDLNTPFKFTGPVTKTDTPFDILAFDASLNLGNGQTLTGQAVLEVLRADVDYEMTGVIPFAFDGVLSDFAFA